MISNYLFNNEYGAFLEKEKEYHIFNNNKRSILPWINILANPDFGTMVTERGGMFSWYLNSYTCRLTPRIDDPILPEPGEVIYIKDNKSGLIDKVTEDSKVVHGKGYSVFDKSLTGCHLTTTILTPINGNYKLVKIDIENLTQKSLSLSITYYSRFLLGENYDHNKNNISVNFDSKRKTVIATNTSCKILDNKSVFLTCNQKNVSFTLDRGEFFGRGGSLEFPESLKNNKLSDNKVYANDPCGALMATIDLEPNSKTNIIFALGVEDNNSRFSQTKLSADNFDLELSKTREYWNNLLNTIQIETPKKEIDLLFNNHLLYQVISSRLWGRTGFFQPGGAYGYRDQLQDILSLFYAAPEMAREHIIMAASRQFSGGGVQHWWHPPENAGVRSLASDTHLWLPYTIIQYIKATNDLSILDEKVPYLAPEKNENRHQGAYFIPEISENNETLKHHLMSSIERSLFLSGKHGLPLMLSGDWNDGLDKIGKDKRGESVWLGMFLKYILEESSSLVETEISKRYLLKAKNLEDIINKTCWDGKWFLRAFWDDGETLGSYKNLEAKIDSIPQSWSVIANFDSKLSRIAVNSANKKLIDRKAQATKLFDPPFDKTPKDPGYIILYPPGVRENGGAYSHAAIWLAMANARIENHKTSLEILDYINPVLKTQTPEGVRTYRGEPYAIAADIYTQPPFSGMAGWTWYTGSASLYYKAILEEILGVEIRGDKIHLNPRVPKDWQKFKVNISLNKASYEIIYNNKLQKKFTKNEIIVDGKKISNSYFTIEPGDHTVELNAK